MWSKHSKYATGLFGPGLFCWLLIQERTPKIPKQKKTPRRTVNFTLLASLQQINCCRKATEYSLVDVPERIREYLISMEYHLFDPEYPPLASTGPGEPCSNLDRMHFSSILLILFQGQDLSQRSVPEVKLEKRVVCSRFAFVAVCGEWQFSSTIDPCGKPIQSAKREKNSFVFLCLSGWVPITLQLLQNTSGLVFRLFL